MELVIIVDNSYTNWRYYATTDGNQKLKLNANCMPMPLKVKYRKRSRELHCGYLNACFVFLFFWSLLLLLLLLLLQNTKNEKKQLIQFFCQTLTAASPVATCTPTQYVTICALVCCQSLPLTLLIFDILQKFLIPFNAFDNNFFII